MLNEIQNDAEVQEQSQNVASDNEQARLNWLMNPSLDDLDKFKQQVPDIPQAGTSIEIIQMQIQQQPEEIISQLLENQQQEEQELMAINCQQEEIKSIVDALATYYKPRENKRLFSQVEKDAPEEWQIDTSTKKKRDEKQDEKLLIKTGLKRSTLSADSSSADIGKFIGEIVGIYHKQGRDWKDCQKEIIAELPIWMLEDGTLSKTYRKKFINYFFNASKGVKVGGAHGGDRKSKDLSIKSGNKELRQKEDDAELPQNDIIKWAGEELPDVKYILDSHGNIADVEVDASKMFKIPNPETEPEAAIRFLKENRTLWDTPKWVLVQHVQRLRKVGEEVALSNTAFRKLVGTNHKLRNQLVEQNTWLRERHAEDRETIAELRKMVADLKAKHQQEIDEFNAGYADDEVSAFQTPAKRTHRQEQVAPEEEENEVAAPEDEEMKEEEEEGSNLVITIADQQAQIAGLIQMVEEKESIIKSRDSMLKHIASTRVRYRNLKGKLVKESARAEKLAMRWEAKALKAVRVGNTNASIVDEERAKLKKLKRTYAKLQRDHEIGRKANEYAVDVLRDDVEHSKLAEHYFTDLMAVVYYNKEDVQDTLPPWMPIGCNTLQDMNNMFMEVVQRSPRYIMSEMLYMLNTYAAGKKVWDDNDIPQYMVWSSQFKAMFLVDLYNVFQANARSFIAGEEGFCQEGVVIKFILSEASIEVLNEAVTWFEQNYKMIPQGILSSIVGLLRFFPAVYSAGNPDRDGFGWTNPDLQGYFNERTAQLNMCGYVLVKGLAAFADDKEQQQAFIDSIYLSESGSQYSIEFNIMQFDVIDLFDRYGGDLSSAINGAQDIHTAMQSPVKKQQQKKEEKEEETIVEMVTNKFASLQQRQQLSQHQGLSQSSISRQERAAKFDDLNTQRENRRKVNARGKLSCAEVAKLLQKMRKYKKSCDKDEMCPICLSSFEETVDQQLVVLSCKHKIHHHCLYSHATMSSDLCATCKAPLLGGSNNLN